MVAHALAELSRGGWKLRGMMRERGESIFDVWDEQLE